MTFEQLIVFLVSPAFSVWVSHVLELLPDKLWKDQADATKLVVSTLLTALAGYTATFLPQLIPSAVVAEYDPLFKAATALFSIVVATLYHVWKTQKAKTTITATDSSGGKITATVSGTSPTTGAISTK